MELCQERRGTHVDMTYLSQERVQPLRPAARGDRARLLRPAEVAYEGLRLARLRGLGMREGDLVKLDILLAGDKVDALSMVVHRDKAYHAGRGSPSGCASRSAPAVRGRDPGGDRVADHRPRVRQAGAQGRDRQVLRRRHHPQAQAPREPGEEAHEAGGPHRGSPGGLPRRARAVGRRQRRGDRPRPRGHLRRVDGDGLDLPERLRHEVQ